MDAKDTIQKELTVFVYVKGITLIVSINGKNCELMLNMERYIIEKVN